MTAPANSHFFFPGEDFEGLSLLSMESRCDSGGKTPPPPAPLPWACWVSPSLDDWSAASVEDSWLTSDVAWPAYSPSSAWFCVGGIGSCDSWAAALVSASSPLDVRDELGGCTARFLCLDWNLGWVLLAGWSAFWSVFTSDVGCPSSCRVRFPVMAGSFCWVCWLGVCEF